MPLPVVGFAGLLLLIPQGGTFFCYLVILITILKKNIINFHFPSKSSVMELVSCISIIMQFWPILFLISNLSKFLLPEFQEQAIVSELKYTEKKLAIVLYAMIVAPLVEELYFRYYLYISIKKKYGVILASLGTSFLFALVHQNVLSFGILLTLGLFLNLVSEYFGKIIYSICCHSIFNGIMIILILNPF